MLYSFYNVLDQIQDVGVLTGGVFARRQGGHIGVPKQ